MPFRVSFGVEMFLRIGSFVYMVGWITILTYLVIGYHKSGTKFKNGALAMFVLNILISLSAIALLSLDVYGERLSSPDSTFIWFVLTLSYIGIMAISFICILIYMHLQDKIKLKTLEIKSDSGNF
jgi:magnesium-transporting ATPase (P-type)